MNNDLAKQLRASVRDFYETHGASFGRTRAIIWNEEKLIAARVKPGMTVVDIGAGNGRFARLLPKDAIYIGFEPSASLRQCADPTIDLRKGGFPSIPLPDQTGDVVTSFAVIQHLPTSEERHDAVKELLRLTKPGGLIAVTSWHPTIEFTKQTITPLPQGEAGDILVSWHAEDANVNRYIHDFSFEEWKELWRHPLLDVERVGLFGRQDWTEELTKGRNWFVVGRKK